jgi:hypothetical protein
MSSDIIISVEHLSKRYRLGQLLSGLTRHFLLMTATPHNGKEEDFQLFLALLDGDRFEGKFRDGVHQVEVSDLMRRMVKENLLKFDGRPLFPERIAYTVPYKLSDPDWLAYGAGFHLGNPNMPTTALSQLGVGAALIPEHPMASEWMMRSLKSTLTMLRDYVAVGGA